MQRSLLFCCLQDTLTVDFTGVCGGVSCPQIIQHYYIERIHLSVMDFLRFTTKQNWRKVVEEPNQEENRQKNGSPYYGCRAKKAGFSEMPMEYFQRCLYQKVLRDASLFWVCHCIPLFFTMDPVLAGYGCWRCNPALSGYVVTGGGCRL